MCYHNITSLANRNKMLPRHCCLCAVTFLSRTECTTSNLSSDTARNEAVLLMCDCNIAICKVTLTLIYNIATVIILIIINPQDCALKLAVNTVLCLPDAQSVSAAQTRFNKSHNVIECPKCHQLSYTIMLEPVAQIDTKKASTSTASGSSEAKLNIVENKFITRPLQDGVYEKCFSCYDPFPFATVKLNCSCVSVMCQVCVRAMIKQDMDTFFGVISCPTCKKDCSTAIQGVRETAICENTLIVSALKHFE